MKKFICLALVIVSITAAGQCPKVPQWISTYYEYWGLKNRYILQTPRQAPPAGCRDTAMTYYNPADNRLHWWTGQTDTSAFPYYPNTGTMSSVDSSYNPQFMVDASAIVIASNAWVLNDTIRWQFLRNSSAHGSSYYDSAKGDNTTHGLHVFFPAVRNVFNTTLTGDEQFSQRTTFQGTSTGLTDWLAFMYVQVPNEMYVTGNGTSAWVQSGRFPSNFTMSAIAGGQANFNVISPAQFCVYRQIVFTYVGTNNYHVRTVNSGLGSFNIGFILVNNATGLDVTTNPTAADVVIVSNAGIASQALNLLTYDQDNQFLANTNVNLWVRGWYEVWMTAKYIDTVHSYVRWQLNYPSATTYKIYRANKSDFSDQVLVHTGNEGYYIDAGLVKGRTYHYKEIAVVAGVDTPVSTWIMSPQN